MPRCSLVLLEVSFAFTACGEGNQPRMDTGEPISCAEGYLPDRGTCVPEACGSGTWGNLEVDDATVYVDIDAPDGGDGTAQAPLRSLQPALDLAGSHGGGLVAVAAGTYPETLEITSDHANVHLAGRCRELVTLDASVGDEETSGVEISSQHGEVQLAGMSIAGSRYVGIMVRTGVVRLVDLDVVNNEALGLRVARASTMAPSILVAEGCDIVGNTVAGALIDGTTTEVTLLNTDIRYSRPDLDGRFGYGINVNGGATLRVEGGLLVGNGSLGLLVGEPETEVTLVDTAIRDTTSRWDGELGFGIQVDDGGRLRAEGCDIAGNTAVGMVIVNPGTDVTLVNTRIRDTRPDMDGYDGYAIDAHDAVSLWAEGCELADNHDAGIVITDPGTQATLVDTVVRDTRPDEHGLIGFGVVTQCGGSLRAEGCDIRGNTSVGLYANHVGTAVRLVDTMLRDTLPLEDGSYGHGIEVNGGAALWANGCELTGSTGAALVATGSGTRVTLNGSAITHTRSSYDAKGATAVGLSCQYGATVSATGLLAQANEGPGLYVNTEGSSVLCTDCDLRSNAFAGAVAIGEGALEIRGSTISGTREGADLSGGVGIYAAQPADLPPPTLLVVDSTISDHLVAGAWLEGTGSYQLESVTFTGSIGIPHGVTTRCGDGVFATGTTSWNGGTGLSLADCTLADNQGAGLFLDDASALLNANTWSGNDTDLLVQGPAYLSPADDWSDVPTTEICPTWSRPTCELDFHLDISVSELDPAMAPVPVEPVPRPEDSRRKPL